MSPIRPLVVVSALLLLLLSTPPPSGAQVRAEAGPRARSWPTGPAAERTVPLPASGGPMGGATAGGRATLLRAGGGRELVSTDSPPSAVRLAVGGVLGGAAGLFSLGFAGAWAADRSADGGDDLAAVGGFFLGGAIGEVLGVAAGVHVADGGRGSFWSDLGISALGGAATLGALALADDDGASAWALAGAGVALQVGLTVRTELGTR